MKHKHYTAQQAAELLSLGYHALRKQLDRDSKKPKRERKYPSARKTECCGAWVISERDLKR
jgi:hypothetical protein